MAVMEVDLPSGYKTSPEVLINLVEKLKLTTTLRAAETDYFKNIFYFDYVSLGLCCTHCLCADNHYVSRPHNVLFSIQTPPLPT